MKGLTHTQRVTFLTDCEGRGIESVKNGQRFLTESGTAWPRAVPYDWATCQPCSSRFRRMFNSIRELNARPFLR